MDKKEKKKKTIFKKENVSSVKDNKKYPKIFENKKIYIEGEDKYDLHLYGADICSNITKDLDYIFSDNISYKNKFLIKNLEIPLIKKDYIEKCLKDNRLHSVHTKDKLFQIQKSTLIINESDYFGDLFIDIINKNELLKLFIIMNSKNIKNYKNNNKSEIKRLKNKYMDIINIKQISLNNIKIRLNNLDYSQIDIEYWIVISKILQYKNVKLTNNNIRWYINENKNKFKIININQLKNFFYKYLD